MDAKSLGFSKNELSSLHAPSSMRFWVAVFALWSAIALVIFGLNLVRASSLGARLAAGGAAFLVLGWLQYALVQAMHEAVHQHFRRATSFLAALLTAWPVGLTRAYADVHFAHHRHAGSPTEDPDHVLYGRFPRSRLELLSSTALHFSGLPAILHRAGQRAHSPPFDLFCLVLVQAVLFAAFSFAVHPLAYFVLWVGPVVTVVKGLGYLRILAEHADPEHPIVFRSFATTFVAGSLLGPFGFCHHAEHHLLMSVPFERLGAVFERRESTDAATLGESFVIHRGSHLHLLWKWFWSLPWR